MKGIFVNQLSAQGVKYADLIVDGVKTIETRSRNMLSACLCERVAIIRTVRGKKPVVIGYADMVGTVHSEKTAAEYPESTFVPEGSAYAGNKWFYLLRNAERCTPYHLPESTVRHGRSWCEF